jgi:RNA polymerase primary sigma factor
MRQLKINKSITVRNTASIDKYLAEIAKVELITAEEEVELAKRIKQGDQIALEKLTKANLRFVVSVAKQYQNQGLSLPDLINEGNLGLIKAAKRFDETRGFKFISYAVWWIRQGILQAIAENSKTIRLPLNQVGLLSKVNKAQEKFIQRNEKEPSDEELAIALDMPEKKIKEARRNKLILIPLEEPTNPEDYESNFLANYVNPDADPTDKEILLDSLKKEIERVLSTIGIKEADVVRLYYGLGGNTPMTMDEIGEKFDLTRERVRQIKDKAIRRLKNTNRAKLLKKYL